MKKSLLWIIPFLLPINMFSSQAIFPWVVYYGEAAPLEVFMSYNPIVLDRRYPKPLEPLLHKNKEILGYLVLTEVLEGDPWYPGLKKQGIVLFEDPNWPGSWVVDVRNPLWKDVVFSEIIPSLKEKGFTGFFLDQIDVSISLEQKNPVAYKGTMDALVKLVMEIHKKYPQQKIMINRGYDIIPQVAPMVSYLLAETLYTYYDFKTKEYKLRSKQEYEWQLSQINALRSQFPHLVFFSLEYCDPKDRARYAEIYEIERNACLRPYVGTIRLDEVVPFSP